MLDETAVGRPGKVAFEAHQGATDGGWLEPQHGL